ncbi:MAG: ParB/RepB/Spo0J family partition protein [Oscillospiraceae bacterium]|nr:ParB/RepB/Spo0J family partition protein [Oscillospiraceae bacterium]
MAAKGKHGLGMGMSALFGETESAPAEENLPVTTLPLSRVEPRQDQPRTEFDEEALRQLADSIREYGLIQPITVRPLDRGYYQIIAGERRWRASRMAGLTEVPVRIIEADDRTTAEMALVENLQREDLNPLEEARGYKKLMADYGLTQEEVAVRVQKSRSAVANSLRLLGLGGGVLEMVERGELSAGHARALLSIAGESQQLAAAKKVAAEGLSVRQTEAMASRLQKQRGGVKDRSRGDGVDYRAEAEQRLTEALGRVVRISGGSRGKITLEFCSADDREALMEALLKLYR